MSPLQGNFYNQIPTQLDINGPELFFIEQPDDVTVSDGGSASFVGIASLRYYGDGTNRGIDLTKISYQWYEVGVGALSGSISTTLSLSSLNSPDDSGRKFYLNATFDPPGYGQSFYNADAVNEPFSSNIVTLTVSPFITITEQPQSVTTSASTKATFFVNAETSNNTNSLLTYQWVRVIGTGSPVNLTDSSTVSGSTTNTLLIEDSNLGNSTIYCIVSHPNSNPLQVQSSSATFSVVGARDLIKFERFDSGGTTATLSDFILTSSSGPTFYGALVSTDPNLISFYAPEKDVRVQMTIAGAAGASKGSFTGGDGGVSVIEFTATKNTEYVLKIGSPLGGGGGTFLYRKASLIAAVGGGGAAGTNANGGAGGGVNNAGSSGGGSNGGSGGAQISVGTLGTNIINPSGSTGGKAASCPPGSYYSTIGVAACSDIGNSVRLVNINGATITNTAFINRGFKAGTAGRDNGGFGSTTEGGGGSGARGGNAGGGSGSAGGGGSGYNDGSIIIRTAQATGNTSTNGYVQIRLGSTNPPGFSSNGIYLDLTELPSTNISLNISTSEESGIFHYINIPGIDNIPENAGSRNYTVQGGRVYGPCSAPNGGLYIGSETPVGGTRTLVVEEGGDDWNDMILSVNQGFFRRITSQS